MKTTAHKDKGYKVKHYAEGGKVENPDWEAEMDKSIGDWRAVQTGGENASRYRSRGQYKQSPKDIEDWEKHDARNRRALGAMR